MSKCEQAFLELPMRMMSYSGTDKKDRNTFSIITYTGTEGKQFTCHCFKAKTMGVRGDHFACAIDLMPLQSAEVLAIIQKAFAKAKEIKNDPFMINRPLPDTPEIVTPAFAKRLLPREGLAHKAIIGQGQASRATVHASILASQCMF